jgi:hypothetical protein
MAFPFCWQVIPDRCEAQVDMGLLLDASGSVSNTDWERTTTFAKDVIEFVAQNSSQTQLAVAIYATTVQPIFQMNTFATRTPTCPLT